MTLRVRPRVKNSRTPNHQLICLTKNSLTLFTLCPLPDGGKLSLWRKLWATVDYVRVQLPGQTHREKKIKLWWKKFKIKRFASDSFENEDRSTKHPNLENEAPNTRKRSTQDSKTKHPKLENEAPKSRNHRRLKDYNFKSCMTQAKPAGDNGCVKALKWPRIVLPSSVKESAKVWTFDHVYFWLIVFQIDHVSLTRLTSADCYRCYSLYCLARVFQNLPAPHKHYGVSDVFADFQGFFPTWKFRVALSNVHRWQISTTR